MNRRPGQRSGMALGLSMLLLLATLPLVSTLLDGVRTGVRGEAWWADHLAAEDLARSAVAEALHQFLTGEPDALEDLYDPALPLDLELEVPLSSSLVAEGSGLEVSKVRIRKERQQGTSELSTGFLRISLEVRGENGAVGFSCLRVFSVDWMPGSYEGVVIETQDLYWERGA